MAAGDPCAVAILGASAADPPPGLGPRGARRIVVPSGHYENSVMLNEGMDMSLRGRPAERVDPQPAVVGPDLRGDAHRDLPRAVPRGGGRACCVGGPQALRTAARLADWVILDVFPLGARVIRMVRQVHDGAAGRLPAKSAQG